MNTVRSILKDKGGRVWSIQADASVFDALKLMSDKEIGALVVFEGEEVAGILSERDYARRAIFENRQCGEVLVREIMTHKVIYIRPDNTIEECMALMTHKRIRHLPVMDENHLVGIISIGDVVKAVISEQQFMIQQLENYITGGIG